MQNELYLIWVPGAVFLIALIVLNPFGMKKARARQWILHLLSSEWNRGRNLRQDLAKEGVPLSKRSFDSIMDQLVEEGKVIEHKALPQLESEDDVICSYRLASANEKSESKICRDSLVGRMTSRTAGHSVIPSTK